MGQLRSQIATRTKQWVDRRHTEFNHWSRRKVCASMLKTVILTSANVVARGGRWLGLSSHSAFADGGSNERIFAFARTWR